MSNLKRTGECKRCGRCCTMAVSGVFSNVSYDQLPAELRELAAGMQCPHLHFLAEVWRSMWYECHIYSRATRPQWCQDYPAEPADLIDGCGFAFEETPEAGG